MAGRDPGLRAGGNCACSGRPAAAFQGYWEYDIASDSVWYSQAYQQLLGHPPQERRAPASRLPRGDLGRRMKSAASAAFARHTSPMAPPVRCAAATEDRVQASGAGSRRRGAVERDDFGRIVSFTGQLIDIHEERQAQLELREIRARFERAVEGSSDGLYEYDLLGGRDLVLPERARNAGL